MYNGVINLFRSAVYPPLTAYSQTQDLAPSIPRNFFSYPRKTGVYCEAKLQGELPWVFCCRNAADKKGASRTPMSATCAESQPLLAKRIRPFGCGKRIFVSRAQACKSTSPCRYPGTTRTSKPVRGTPAQCSLVELFETRSQ